MGVLDKIKNALFEVEYVEVDEETKTTEKEETTEVEQNAEEQIEETTENQEETTETALQKQNTYETIKTKAVENLRSGDFTSANSRLNLMEPYIDDSNRNEYQSLLNQLQDSITNSYNKANALRGNKQYELAIITLPFPPDWI